MTKSRHVRFVHLTPTDSVSFVLLYLQNEESFQPRGQSNNRGKIHNIFYMYFYNYVKFTFSYLIDIWNIFILIFTSIVSFINVLKIYTMARNTKFPWKAL